MNFSKKKNPQLERESHTFPYDIFQYDNKSSFSSFQFDI